MPVREWWAGTVVRRHARPTLALGNGVRSAPHLLLREMEMIYEASYRVLLEAGMADGHEPTGKSLHS